MLFYPESLQKNVTFHNAGAPGSVTADLLLVTVFGEGQNKLELF